MIQIQAFSGGGDDGHVASARATASANVWLQDHQDIIVKSLTTSQSTAAFADGSGIWCEYTITLLVDTPDDLG